MNSKFLIIILCTFHEICCESSDEKLQEDSRETQISQAKEDKITAKELDYEDLELEEVRLNDEDLEKEKVIEAGDPADRFGTNQHYSIPVNYEDFGRRFVLSYPYEKEDTIDAAEIDLDNTVQKYLEAKKEFDNHLKPVKAPPEFVLSIAQQSALLEAMKSNNPADDVITKNILRTGDFWNGVWKEDVDRNKLLRTSHKKNTVSVKIPPGSKLHELLLVLQEKSPTLLYVINKKE